MSGYSEKEYHHIVDLRTPQQREQQHTVVEQIYQRNLKVFKIDLTDKKKVFYTPRQKKRVDLGDGWYCNITDSGNSARHTILSLHGAPGDHIEWAGLQTQMGPSYRWVNLTTPGFDGEDQRRGSYDGSSQHFGQLILKLLKQLKVSKVILCAHSLGSIYSSYFITKHPQAVEGYINITGIVDMWYTGLLTFFQTVVAEYGYNSEEWRSKRLWDDDHQRVLIHHKFLQVADGRFFGPVEFPKLTLTEFFAYFRLINTLPNGLSELYALNKNLKLLRVLIFGKKDPLHELHKTQESIFNVCRSEASYINLPQYKKLFSSIKKPIQKRLKQLYGVQIEGDKLQQYFCYHFFDTGHNAHKRRPVQMARVMKIYITCLEVIQEYSQAVQAKL